jgi:hypothetical protein
MLEELAADGTVVGLGGGFGGPIYLEVPDVSQRAPVSNIVSAVMQSANYKADDADSGRSAYQMRETADEARADERPADGVAKHERRVRAALKQKGFLFAAAEQARGRLWHDVTLQCGKRILPCGIDGKPKLNRVAAGSLLPRAAGAAADGGAAAGGAARSFDAEMGTPTLSEARRLVEMTLTLRLAPKGEKPSAAAAAAGGRGGAAAGRGGAGRKRKAVA